MYGIYSEEKTVFDKINLERKTLQIIVRYNRTNYPINVSDISYLESLADYIKIVLVSADEIVTKEKISHILERLPSSFLRIHRSFIINVNELKSYNKEFVSIGNTNIPISRTYKKMALKQLESL
jgi:DNA-binding LytR/AlgR family response regulator